MRGRALPMLHDLMYEAAKEVIIMSTTTLKIPAK